MNRLARLPWPWIALVGVLLILCIRLTAAEPVNAGEEAGFSSPLAAGFRYPGAAEIIGFSLITLSLAGVALLRRPRLNQFRIPRLLLIAALIAVALVSCFHAANHFAALIGIFDLGMALMAGWLTGLLCDTDRKRGFVVAVLAGLLAAICVKGFYQYFFELPLTAHWFYQNQATVLPQMGIQPGSMEARLFAARLNSHDVNGFLVLSDVLAEAMLPLLLVTMALGMAIASQASSLTDMIARREKCTHGTSVPAPIRHRELLAGGSAQHGTSTLFFGILLLVLFIFGSGVVVLTRSKGGIAALVLCAAVFIFAWRFQGVLTRHRWKIVALAFLAAAIVAAGILAYGLGRHTLPTRDLRFRWQYWMGAARMVEQHPLLGVGLNNFGYYYPRYKSPQAPEVVKDPHNPFVRMATEAGWPAAILWAALLLIAMVRVVGRDRPDTDSAGGLSIGPHWLGGFVLLWWGGRFLVTGPGIDSGAAMIWPVFMDCVYALAAFIAMVVAQYAWNELTIDRRRAVALAAVLGAAGMCLYDQVNMALVTGSAAMLFWMVLGAFDARTVEAEAQGHIAGDPARARSRHGVACRSGAAVTSVPIAVANADTATRPGYPDESGLRRDERRGDTVTAGLGALLLAGALVLGLTIWLPVYDGSWPWDPASYSRTYDSAMKQGNWAAALYAVDGALAIDRRSQTWLTRRIELEMALGLNPRRDVLRLLRWNPTSPRVRLPWAKTSRSGLTVPERIQQLKLALKLNDALPPHDITRLSVAHAAQIQKEISRLGTDISPQRRRAHGGS